MRIIKPQQLVVIKNGYQIGQQSWLGVSVVAGCWLNKTSHFTTEAQIWQAWRTAPQGLPILDCAEPKPYAEFLLAGTVSRSAPATDAAVNVRVGELARSWHIQAAFGQQDKRLPFTPCPLTHQMAAQTADNPDGTAAPRLFSAVEGDELVAPEPVPHYYPLRQRWLTAVQHEMQDEAYQQQIFPGMPASLDHRCFQLAPQTQQLNAACWPEATPIVLQGWQHAESEINFTLPAVQARCWFNRHQGDIEEIAMPLKTLWLLPDTGLVLMISTGVIPLTHLLDESVSMLCVALDNSATPRATSHYHHVITKRTSATASPFEFVYDPDLMPAHSALDAVLFGEKLPANPPPCDQSRVEQGYAKLRQLLDEQSAQPQQATPPDVTSLVTLPAVEIHTQLPVAPQSEGKTFTLMLNGALSEKHFIDCHFMNCHFSDGQWEQLSFKRCRFENCSWQNIAISNSQLEQCQFSQCRASDLKITDTQLSEPQFSACDFNQFQSFNCQWLSPLFQRCQWPSAQFYAGKLQGWTLDHCHLPNLRLHQLSIERALWHATDLRGFNAQSIYLIKSSVMACNLSQSDMRESEWNSVTFGQQCDLSGSQLLECVLHKVGLAKSDLRNTRFIACAWEESSASHSQLQHSHFLRCELAGLMLQQANLLHSHWQESSLQQACLHNASLHEATFLRCNLSGANLAQADYDQSTLFDDCLMEAVCWLPRRSRSTMKEAG